MTSSGEIGLRAEMKDFSNRGPLRARKSACQLRVDTKCRRLSQKKALSFEQRAIKTFKQRNEILRQKSD